MEKTTCGVFFSVARNQGQPSVRGISAGRTCQPSALQIDANQVEEDLARRILILLAQMNLPVNERTAAK